MKYTRPLVLAIFFLSGASGLIYEIIWARQLSLVFGVSSFAVSTVLTVFMAGLGIGGYVFGRVIDKRGNPLKIYAALEMLIGIYALLLPYTISFSEWLYVKLQSPFLPPFIKGGDGGVSFFLLSAERFVISFFILIFPTIMMGGTLPVISRLLIRNEERIGSDAGIIYSLNTFGAVAGCLLTGFYLIENIGITFSLYLAAALNFIAAGGAYIIGSRVKGQGSRERESGAKVKGQGSGNRDSLSLAPLPLPLILIAFGFSGMAALSFEVLWTRILILILDNTVYAFSTILFTFLLGIAGGSLIYSRLIHKLTIRNPKSKIQNPITPFAIFQILIGLMGFLSLLLFANHNILSSWLNNSVSWASQFIGMGFWHEKLTALFLISFIIMAMPTIFMGASFPAVAQTLKRVSGVGEGIGRIYLINTIGAIIGSFSAGFILLPLIGIQKSIIFTGAIPILFGIAILIFVAAPFRVRGLPQAKASGYLHSGVIAYVLPVSSIIISVIIVVFIFRAGDIPKLISISKIDKGNEILYYKEGIAGTVLISSRETDLTPYRKPVKRLWINGDPIAGEFRGALQLERLQAHIPLLFHPDPHDALVICFGTGSTAGAVSDHPVKEIYAVDISKEVFEGGRYFHEGNRNILDDPRIRIVIEDGRNFLLTTDKKFDFITSEPPPPSNAGIINLYTREYYMLCKSRLKQGGMVSQWIPLHHLPENDFKMLVSAFVSVFPRSTMWFTKWDAIMIGSDSGLNIDFDRLENRIKEKKIAESLKEIGISNPFQILSTFVMDENGLSGFINGAPAVSDDRPSVEFSAPRIHHAGLTIKGRNLENMLKYRKPVTGMVRQSSAVQGGGIAGEIEKYFNSYSYFLKGQINRNDNRFEDAAGNFAEAVNINDENSDARHELISLYMDNIYKLLNRGEIDKGFNLTDECAKLDRDGGFSAQLHNLKGLLFLSRKDIKRAVNEFENALRLDEKYLSPYLNLGSVYTYYESEPLKAIVYYSKGLELKITAQERDLINLEVEKIKAQNKINGS